MFSGGTSGFRTFEWLGLVEELILASATQRELICIVMYYLIFGSTGVIKACTSKTCKRRGGCENTSTGSFTVEIIATNYMNHQQEIITCLIRGIAICAAPG